MRGGREERGRKREKENEKKVLGALLSRGTSMSDEDEPAPSPSAAVVARRASRIALLTVKTLTGMTTDVYPRENCIAI